MKIAGNTILVTGGTSGIGRGLAEAFHDRGNKVIVTGRRQPLLDDIATSRPGIAGIRLDLDERSSMSRLSQEVGARFPSVNVLIANAGISRPEDLTADDWEPSAAEAMVETNILGVLRAVSALLPILKRQQDATIMATTSNLAFVPLAAFPTYCASKAFLHSWLQSLRHQLRNTSIDVMELAPPYVQTELVGAHQLADPRAMPLSAYVAEVMQCLESGNHADGEVLVERGRDRRSAERDGRYEAVFAAINPG